MAKRIVPDFIEGLSELVDKQPCSLEGFDIYKMWPLEEPWSRNVWAMIRLGQEAQDSGGFRKGALDNPVLDLQQRRSWMMDAVIHILSTGMEDCGPRGDGLDNPYLRECKQRVPVGWMQQGAAHASNLSSEHTTSSSMLLSNLLSLLQQYHAVISNPSSRGGFVHAQREFTQVMMKVAQIQIKFAQMC
jgi:hypothetical protein